MGPSGGAADGEKRANKNVIDNENIKLVEQLQKTLPNATRASIAVGYFFISGFARIMDSFEKIENSDDEGRVIRLLISPTTNRATAEALLAGNESYNAVRDGMVEAPDMGTELDRARDEIKRTLEHMPQTGDDSAAALKLRDLMRRGKMQVRVYTKEQLHAKAYIFELEGGEIDAMAVVGSSNLSVSGISQHTELNLRTTHSEDSEALLEWFDRHWDDEGCTEFTGEMADIIDRSWIKRREPQDVYNKALLHEHEEKFNLCVIKDPPPGPDVKKLFDFQRVAVAHAVKKLDAFGGVMISDVVGTGKTLIGTAILRHLVEEYRSNLLIICPPHLIGMWEKYLDDYRISGTVLSRHKIGLDETLLPKYSNRDVILIDESHNFRTKTTRSYQALSAFMEEKTDEARIIMLSATPISNKLADLKNQLALFPKEMLSKIDVLGQTDLDEYFRGTTNQDGTVTDPGREKIQALLRHILIRRTRKQIKDKYAEYDESKRLHFITSDGKRRYFPDRVLKNPEEYDIEKVYKNAFQQITDALKGLKLARYNPGEYLREEYSDPNHPQFAKYDELRRSSMPLVGIVRTSLLKRVESSIQAFHDSVHNYQEGHMRFQSELEKGRVPIGKDFHDIIYRAATDSDYEDVDYDRDMGRISTMYDSKAFDMDRWIEDIKHDRAQFATMNGYLGPESEFAGHDDKLSILVELLKGLAGDKILIFTESASTARYLATNLGSPKIQGVIGGRAIEQIDSRKDVSKSDVIWRFDPVNNAPPRRPGTRGEIDILVSTDVLSEGVNLQSGRVVINYDFHWNPVRLIQRVGRVDRIGTNHEKIEIFNFLPTTKGEAELGLRERVAKKIELIRSIMGGDQHILEDTETFDPDSVAGIYAGNDDVLDVESVGILDMEDSKADHDSDILMDDKTMLEQIRALPFGMRSASGSGTLLVACEANETVIRSDGKVVADKKFRKHYAVTGGADGSASPIWQSQFLKRLGDSAGASVTYDDSEYNRLVGTAWKAFERDAGNAVAERRPRIHQRYFERKLRTISSNHALAPRASRLQPFIVRMMVSNDEPYRSLVALHKKIDATAGIDDITILSELESIERSHTGATYARRIIKPRILYSMMVRS